MAYIGTSRAKFADSKKRNDFMKNHTFFDFSTLTKLNHNNHIANNVAYFTFFLRSGVFLHSLFTFPENNPLYFVRFLNLSPHLLNLPHLLFRYSLCS